MSRKTSMSFVFVIGSLFSSLAANGQSLPNLFPFPNATGLLATNNASNEAIDLTGPFFQPLGTNGRICGSCHRPAQGWCISAQEVKSRFQATQGLDPIFRTNDGSNCDHNIDTSTVQGRRKAYSLLKFLDVPIRKREPQIPTDRANNYLGFEVPPFEQRWPQFDHGIYCSLSDSFTEFLQHSPSECTNCRADDEVVRSYQR